MAKILSRSSCSSPKQFCYRQLTCWTTILTLTTDSLRAPDIFQDLLSVMLVSPQARSIRLMAWTGKHLRHARDHFQLLLTAASSSSPRILSYDIRVRNTPMESSRSAARESIQDTIKQLEALVPRAKTDDPLILQAVTPFLQEFQTTFGREVSAHIPAVNPC